MIFSENIQASTFYELANGSLVYVLEKFYDMDVVCLRFEDGTVFTGIIEELQYSKRPIKKLDLELKSEPTAKTFFVEHAGRKYYLDQFCSEIIDHKFNTIFSQFNAFGFVFKIELVGTPDSDLNKDVHEFLMWVLNNLDTEDYYITKYYDFSEKHLGKLEQTGHILFIREWEQVSLIKLLWGDVIKRYSA